MAKGNKMLGFIHYNNTKAAFIAAGHPATYNDAIVFIAGDTSSSSCIYTHGKYFATADEAEKYLNTIPYFKGIKVGNTTYNAANGGGYLALAANDPATLTINTNSDGVVIGLTSDAIECINTAARTAEGDTYVSAEIANKKFKVTTNVETDLSTSAAADKLPTAKSVKDYVVSKIDALEVPDTAKAGQYVSAVSESNGKISVFRADLPTLTEGTVDGEVVYGDTAVKVHGLKSAAYTESSAYATSAQGALADSAVQGIAEGDYITVSGTGTTKTVVAKVQKISTATTAKQGFADALDVKTELGGVNDRAVAALDQIAVWTGKNNENYSADETKSIRNISAEEVAKIVAGADESYDTLKEIADWIKSDTTGAAKMVAGINQNKEDIGAINDGLNTFMQDTVGDSNGAGTIFDQLTSINSELESLGGGAGSIANQIKTEIEKLDSPDTAVSGEYVSAVSEENGVISVAREKLPTYTLAPGETDGTIKLNDTEVKVKNIKSAAFTEATDYAKATEAITQIQVNPKYLKVLTTGTGITNTTPSINVITRHPSLATETADGLATAYETKAAIATEINIAFTWEELS